MPKKSTNRILSMLLVIIMCCLALPIDNVGVLTAYGASVGMSGDYGKVTTKVTMNNSPVTGVEVFLYNTSTSGYMPRGTTDANGDVTIETWLPRDYDYYFYINGSLGNYSDYNGRALGNTFDFSGNRPPKDIELVTGYDVESKVYIDNLPAGNVNVSLSLEYDTWKSTVATNADGSFKFIDVPYGRYKMSIENSKNKYFGETSPYFYVPSTQPYHEFKLIGTHKVEVPVMFNDGTPVPDNTRVDLKNAGSGSYNYSGIGNVSNGIAVFDNVLTSDSYYFYVYGQQNQYLTYDGQQLDKVFAVPGSVPAIVLDKGESITATISLSNGYNAPDGYSVWIYQNIGTTRDTEIAHATSVGGKAIFYTLPRGNNYYFKLYGKYGLAYDGKAKGEYFSFPSDTQPQIILPDQDYISTTVTLQGLPIANAKVTLASQNDQGYWYDVYEGSSDQNGRATFPMYTGNNYFFYVEKGDGYAEYLGRDKGKFFSLPGSIPTIELDKGYNITPTVMLDGAAVSGVEVYLYEAEMYDWLESAISDSNGKVTFYGLTAGKEYYFYVPKTNNHTGYSKWQTFKPDQNSPTTIALSSGNSCSTTVTYQGIPIVGHEVVLYHGRTNLSEYSTTVTDSNGVATFGGLPSSSYFYFSVKADRYQVFPYDELPYADYNGRLNNAYFRLPGTAPNIELEQANKVKVGVALETGESLSSVRITLNYVDSDDKSLYSKSINHSGWLGNNPTYDFENLPTWNRCYFSVERIDNQNAAYDGLKKGEFFSVPGTVPDIILEVGHTVKTNVMRDGVPQRDVNVRLQGGLKAKTNANGQATFVNLSTEEAAYFMVSRKEGEYAQFNGAIKGQIFNIPATSYPDIHLETGHTVSALVTYRGVLQADIDVQLYQSAPNSKNDYVGGLITDSTGRVSLTNIATGSNYYFTAFDYEDKYSEYDGSKSGKLFTVPGSIPNIELDPNYYPYSNSNSNTGGGGGGGGGGSGGGGGLSSSIINTPTTTMTSSNLKTILDTMKTNGANYALFRFSGQIKIPAAICKALGNTPLWVDTTGSPVQVRLIIPNPGKITTDIMASGAVKGADVDKIKSLFEKWYKNKVRVVHMDHKGAWGQPVEISAKVDFTGMDTKNIYLYSYNAKTYTYSRIEKSAYWIDTNKYIHFTTELADEIVISDGALVKK